MRRISTLATLAALVAGAVTVSAQDGFRFRSGVELINVTASVTDDAMR